MNNLNHVLALFIDYSKAFDTLDHEILFELDNIGIRGTVLNLIKSFLNNRVMVKINNIKSDKKTKFWCFTRKQFGAHSVSCLCK
jgi:hypothetical protein